MSTSNLEAAAAALITRLPDSFGDLMLGDIDGIAEMWQRIGETMHEAADVERDVIKRIRPRITAPDQPIGGVATAAEVAELDGAARRYLSAERAAAALDGWSERSGCDAYKEATGHAPRKTQPTAVEEPDGTLTFEVRR